MTSRPQTIRPTAGVRRDVPAQRPCLRCRTSFWSEGFGERICARCKGTAAWRTSVSPGSGRGGRRGGAGLS